MRAAISMLHYSFIITFRKFDQKILSRLLIIYGNLHTSYKTIYILLMRYLDKETWGAKNT